MTALAALLAGERPAAVLRWGGARAVEDVVATAYAAGWDPRHLEGERARDKAGFLAEVGRALGFPATYGHNLDALADLLDDLGARTLLVWDDWHLLAETDPRTFAVVVELLGERCADPGRPAFAVLLRGDGPTLPGVEELAAPS